MCSHLFLRSLGIAVLACFSGLGAAPVLALTAFQPTPTTGTTPPGPTMTPTHSIWSPNAATTVSSVVDNQRTSRQSSSTTSALFARRRYYYEDEEERGRSSYLERSTDRPTQTLTLVYGPGTKPAKPKIIVLGATGRIGRLVVRHLMEMSIDATIVAFVRNYDKACDVLMDEDQLVLRNDGTANTGKPQLQLVVGDLVPPEEVCGYADVDDEIMLANAQSASTFYGNDLSQYDYRHERPDSSEALEEAIKGCTVIINCVGTVRPTNIWTDLLARPLWRILRKDVSGWCKDSHHPYYVNYATTRKVLGMAEREQRRREAVAAASAEEDDRDDNGDEKTVERIKIVRISDLCVTQKPWDFVPVVTNALQSMVFRYQDMAERVLEESSMVDTIILRPGDLVDEERDVNTTSLQVDSRGLVPSPARVGRSDVAALAVAAALSKTDGRSSDSRRRRKESEEKRDPIHYALGVRWASENLQPYPAQGTKSDGLPDAQTCMNRVIKLENRKAKRQRRREMQSKADRLGQSVARMTRSLRSLRRRRLKPYGICVAIPVYLLLVLLGSPLLQHVPGLELVGPFVMRHLPSIHLTSIRRYLPKLPKRVPQSYISF